MTTKENLFDSGKICRHRARAKRNFARHAFLHNRVLDDLRDRLDMIKRDFEAALLCSPFAGAGLVVPADFDQVETVLGPALRAAPHDLVISLLHLHIDNDLPNTLVAICRNLRPDGLFLGALFGERTLHRLRQCLLEAESALLGGAQARIIPFAEVRALGGLLQRAGFALPVVDVDRVTVHYKTLSALLHDIRGMGEANPLCGPVRPLRRDVLALTEALYKERYGDKDGFLPARFDIVHLSGWAPHESQQKPLKPGSAEVSFKDVFKP